MTVARIEIVGLGPAGEDLLTSRARSMWESSEHRFLRTRRHPAAEALCARSEVESFDHLYEGLDTFDDVYRSIADELVSQAQMHDRVLYAVPGSPAVAEASVELLLERASVDDELVVSTHPAMSFLDLVWSVLGIDPLSTGVRLLDGHRFAESLPCDGGAVLVAQCESRFTLSDIKLAVPDVPAEPVVLLKHLGLPDQVVMEVDWADIDRSIEADHLTSLWIPHLRARPGAGLSSFASLVERLRVEDGWKAAQTHRSLGRHLIEEAYETLEAIEAYDPEDGTGSRALSDELGDLLYQVVFHASLGAEAGHFDLDDVVAGIHGKLTARHDLLDGPETSSVEDLGAQWERAKRSEPGRGSAFDGIPGELPALLRALKLTRTADALGLATPVPATRGPGADLLAAARSLIASGTDPEDALRQELRALEEALRAEERVHAEEQPRAPEQ